MAISEVDIKLIEKHLQGHLTPDEKIVFEQRKSDTEFLVELDLYLALKKSSNAIGREQVKQTFLDWDQETAHNKIRKWPQIGWKIAAGLLIVIGFIGLLKIFSPTKDSKDLFAEYYQPYPNLIDPIQKGDPSPTSSITQLYELGNYENVLKQSPTDLVDSFYVALSYLQLDQRQDALVSLQKIVNRAHFRFRDAAQWYLALNLLLENQIEASKQILTEIGETAGNDYQILAANLLAELQE